MPFLGNGTFVRVYRWQTDAANGLEIAADRFDAEDDGFATGLSNCITRDGQSPPTAAIPWGNQNLTGVNALSAASGAFSGSLTVGGTFAVTGNVTFSGTLSVTGIVSVPNASTIKDNGTGATGTLAAAADRRIAYRGMPKKTISTAYTVTVDDVGYCLEVVAGGSIIFPRNSTLVGAAQFSPHDSTIVIQNCTTGNITLTQATSSTLTNVADGTSGNKTLKTKGRAVADLSLNLADTWFIGGSI